MVIWELFSAAPQPRCGRAGPAAPGEGGSAPPPRGPTPAGPRRQGRSRAGSSAELPAGLPEPGTTTSPPAASPLTQLPAPKQLPETRRPASPRWHPGSVTSKPTRGTAARPSPARQARRGLGTSPVALPTHRGAALSRARPGPARPAPARGARGPAARGSASSGRGAGQQPNPVSRRSVQRKRSGGCCLRLFFLLSLLLFPFKKFIYLEDPPPGIDAMPCGEQGGNLFHQPRACPKSSGSPAARRARRSRGRTRGSPAPKKRGRH